MPRVMRVALALALAAPTILVTGLAISTASAAGNTAGGLAVSVGYAEDKETNNPNAANFPVPWQGSPNVVFLGGPVPGQSQCGTLPTCYDTGAVRLDNPTSSAIAVSGVSVDIHSSIPGGKVFNLWGSFSVPAGQSVILAANPPGDTAKSDDFDTSGFPGNVCTPITVAPTVTITVGGVPTTLTDSTHVLDTGGIDLGFCGNAAGKNESIQWRPIGASGSYSATLSVTPGTSALATGGSVTETATLVDGGGVPVPNVAVAFAVASGPNAGVTGSATTDSGGHASFSYTDTLAGIDIVAASVTTVGSFSTQSIVTWGSSVPTWTGVDIGPPPLAGSDSFSNGVWTITGNGRDIGGTADQFHFVSQPVGGDAAISARVATQTNSNGRARAGVMFRQSLDPAAPFVALVTTPTSGIWVLERPSFGGQVVTLVTISGAAPAFLRLDRTGSLVTASTSPDGVTWTAITGGTGTFGVSGAVLAGLAVTSHDVAKLGTATFDSVTLLDFGPSATPTPTTAATATATATAAPTPTPTAAPTATPVPTPSPTAAPTATPVATPTPSSSPGALPSPWLDTDVGAPSPAGSATYNAGLFTVNGEGTDVFNTSDQFHYVYQNTTGNGTIVARVTSETNAGSTNDKAGVMWKASTAAGSPYILIAVNYQGLVKVQYNFSNSVTTSTFTYPNVWMKIVRSGSLFSAYLSPDGLGWTAVFSNLSLPAIPTAATVGIYECSHKPGALGTATFDNVSFVQGP